MKKALLIYPLILGILSFTFIEEDQIIFSDYHSESMLHSFTVLAGKSGAPTEPNCTQCHAGSAISGNGVNTLVFSGVNNEYVPGQTYTFDLDVANSTTTGFQMTGLDNSDIKAGDFIAGANTNVQTGNSREYVNHSNGNNSSWDFEWTAPSTGVGDVTFYLATNKANGNGNTAGDQIFLTELVLIQASGVGVDIAMKPVTDMRSVYDVNANAVNLSFNTQLVAKFSIKIHDLQGKEIQSQRFGKSNQGNNNQTIKLNKNLPPGVYIVTVLLGTEYFTEKIFIQR